MEEAGTPTYYWRLLRGYVSTPPIWYQFWSNFILLKFSVWTLKYEIWWKINKNWMTRWISRKFAHFWGSVKIGQILFWSISSKYMTVSIWGSYLFSIIFHNIVRDLFLFIWLKFEFSVLHEWQLIGDHPFFFMVMVICYYVKIIW